MFARASCVIVLVCGCAAGSLASEYFDAVYGELLPGSSEQVGLWWASSGWKIGRERGLPQTKGEAIIIRAAKNEAEAAQLVVRPKAAVKGLAIKPETLRGPAGAKIPAAGIEVLEVRYVNVTRPTDKSAVAGLWPDPLPPLEKPLDLQAGKNQPFWIRVNVPRDARAGVYQGTISVTADGFSLGVPLRVEVYDFELPSRMTCTTAFGFSAGTVFRYQGISDPQQKREVLEKYWANLSAHHISPYDPAPLDPVGVTWPDIKPPKPKWQGGQAVTNEKHSGEHALLIFDDRKDLNVEAVYEPLVPIPEGGLRLRFWYRTAVPGQAFLVTLNHHDESGKWISGGNNDIGLEGNGQWQEFSRVLTQVPEGRQVRAASPAGGELDRSRREHRAGLVRRCLIGERRDGRGVDRRRRIRAAGIAAGRAGEAPGEVRFHRLGQGDGAGHRPLRLQLVPAGHSRHGRRDVPLPRRTRVAGLRRGHAALSGPLRRLLPQIQEHLRAKGWLDEAYVYWFDEPDPKDYAFVSNGFAKLKAAAPDISRMLTEQVEPALIGGPNIWCPISDQYKHDFAEPRREHGEKFWWYVCTGPKAPYCTLFIDHPGTELRIWLWQTWQRKIEGILVWETNYWTSGAAYPDREHPQNPYEDPMGWQSGYSTPAGQKRAWGNGDGRFIYPPVRAADARPAAPVLEGPVDSIRWEMLRDGIEDYEYFVILKRLIAAKGGRIDAARKNGYAALLDVPAGITKT